MADKKKSTFKDKLHAFWTVIKHFAKRVWAYLKVAKMEYIVMISLFALDLISKAIVGATMNPGDTVTIIPYVLNIHYTHNPNAAFGSSWMTSWLGSAGSRIFFCVFSVAASVIFILVLIRHKGGSKLFRVALAMLVAGAMGNCIDRWALGYVRDFVQFVYFGLTIFGEKTFYVFNIADAELVIGVVLIIIYFIFVYKDKSSEKKRAKRAGKAAATAAAADGNAEANSQAADEAKSDETSNGASDGGEPIAEEADKLDESKEQNDQVKSDGETDGDAGENSEIESAPDTHDETIESGGAN